MMAATGFELLGQLEDEFEEEGALDREVAHELAPGRKIFPLRRGGPPALANLGRAKTLLVTVSGFSRYRQEVRSLPSSEQARIERVARLVVASQARGRRLVVTIRLVGHADFDTLRRSAFERRISDDRARRVGHALVTAIDRHAALALRRPLARQIRWESVAMGATRPLYPTPRTMAERARNRRVDILLESVPFSGEPGPPG